MKTVLCYGDSNTWGYNPRYPGMRYDYEKRWTTVLQKELGSEYLVIPEGQSGRTTVFEDPIERNRNGASYLPACLDTHKPLDWVVIMLGTNDLKQRFSVPACDIAGGVGVLIDIIRHADCGPDFGLPNILVLVPPAVKEITDSSEAFAGAAEKSLKLPEEFRKMLEMKPHRNKIHLFETGKHVVSSNVDGIHFDEDQLEILGRVVAGEIVRLS